MTDHDDHGGGADARAPSRAHGAASAPRPPGGAPWAASISCGFPDRRPGSRRQVLRSIASPHWKCAIISERSRKVKAFRPVPGAFPLPSRDASSIVSDYLESEQARCPADSQKIKKLNELEQNLRKQALPTADRAQPTSRPKCSGSRRNCRNSSRSPTSSTSWGSNKFEPAKERQILALRLRRMVNATSRRPTCVSACRTVNSRFQSYWRLLGPDPAPDRGRPLPAADQPHEVGEQLQPRSPGGGPSAPAPAETPLDRIYRELVEAHESCQIPAPPARTGRGFSRAPDRRRSANGSATGRSTSWSSWNDGKPKIKVRAKG